jgi:signal transduction histidine kinase
VDIVLYSADKRLHELCSGIAARGGNGFSVGTHGAGPPVAGKAYIYDLGDSTLDDLPQDGPFASSIVIIDQPRLVGVRDRLLNQHALTLLKPVTRPVLEVALARIEANSTRPLSAAGGTLDAGQEYVDRLLSMNLTLQEREHDRSIFLARSVHEFRAPLTALAGYCDLLLGRRLGQISPEQELALSRMHHALNRLSGIVSAIFQLSLGEAQVPRLAIRDDYLNCVETALGEFAPVFESRNIKVSIELQACPAALMFDREQIERVFVNLFDNCSKFTPSGGSVSVFGYPTLDDRLPSGLADSYRVDIADSGPGIPPEHLETIFEEYATLGTPTDRAGAGLGLPICKAIITAHRGRIWVESDGGSATFSVVLPARPD